MTAGIKNIKTYIFLPIFLIFMLYHFRSTSFKSAVLAKLVFVFSANKRIQQMYS